ncbi:D-tagatose-1,6-bisphosphate aldolase subunit KbaZ [Clostridia bacterium]|nr:D-tagatose-1,6-bisphosphate aldolase subunit KbaZ [Clostridia bacterium]
MKYPIRDMINRRAAGEKAGMYSACTANAHVLRAVFAAAREHGSAARPVLPVLIEATANQCNQFGGYTGMVPADFVRFVCTLSREAGYDSSLLILGGDHLGPLVWQDEPEKTAMAKAEDLVRAYVAAGFRKIHLDTSMRLADDDAAVRLSDETIARRAVRLALACEEEAARTGVYPEYVIGSEVPIPGGTQEEEDGVCVTSPADFEQTFLAFRTAFEAAGLSDAFARVVGVVVQPGVEFGDDQIIEYNRAKAADLTRKCGESAYRQIVFEGHSTDYQTPASLREMVEDGIAILKVGPALTFYFREAVFALAEIEQELGIGDPSDFKAVLESAMQGAPDNWQKYYRGTEAEQAYKRKYSLSDRSRYYFPDDRVREAFAKLIQNIDRSEAPISILSQYLPSALARLRRAGKKAPYAAEDLIEARIKDVIEEYLYATGDIRDDHCFNRNLIFSQ